MRCSLGMNPSNFMLTRGDDKMRELSLEYNCCMVNMQFASELS